jgi:large subunit ribosomal protein L5
MAAEKINKMRALSLDKVTVNICVGNDKPGMIKAEKLIRILTNKTPVKANAKRRLALWQIRPGLPIGYKVTLREQDAKDFLVWIFKSKGNKLKKSSLDVQGNFALGVSEYLDLSGMKYDADIGIMGFELMATFTRPGFRIKSRRNKQAKIPQRHKVTQEEVIEYVQNNLGVEVQ